MKPSKNPWDDSPWYCFHIVSIRVTVLAGEEVFFVKDAPDHNGDCYHGDDEGEQRVEKECKAKSNGED